MLVVAYPSLIIQSDMVYTYWIPIGSWCPSISLFNDKSWLRFPGAVDVKFSWNMLFLKISPREMMSEGNHSHIYEGEVTVGNEFTEENFINWMQFHANTLNWFGRCSHENALIEMLTC